MNPVEQTEVLFLLLLIFVIGFGSVARLVKIPYPIVLVIAGLLLSLVPRLPRFHLNPDFVFLAVLPPLLFSAAFNTSWREFRYHFANIFLLAFVLVAFTVFGVALMAHFLLPGFDWRLGLVLGAVVAPTDAIAAVSIAKRIGLPKDIIDLLEGESLINDASGLLALEFTTALIVTGQMPTLTGGLSRLVILIAGGIAVGLIVGKLVYLFEKRIDDAPIEITLSLVVPYIAYIGAEALHCSGVLSAVTAGLYLGTRSSDYLSSAVRIESHGFWNTFTFVLNGLVFLLIGLQLPYVLTEIRGIAPIQLAIDAAEFVLGVILLRLVFTYPGAQAGNFIRRTLLKQTGYRRSPKGIFVVGWTGMRGVISLAAAIALPEELADGSPFPQRNVIIFLTFCIIFATLVLQGLTLPALIRKLGLARNADSDAREREMRKYIVEAAMDRLREMRENDRPEFRPAYDDLLAIYARRFSTFTEQDGEDPLLNGEHFRQVSGEVRAFERATALELRNTEQISEDLFRTLQHELDLIDLRFSKQGAHK